MKKAEDMVVNAELQKRIVEAAKSLFLEKGSIKDEVFDFALIFNISL